MLIASWNVNSLAARLGHFCDWLVVFKPDVALLQELKCTAGNFPFSAVSDAGYHAAIVGQKAYNGVAIITREPVTEVLDLLPVHERQEGETPAARYIEATVNGVRVASVYVPNGEDVASEKYPYKLAFYRDLRRHLQSLATSDMPFVLGGDFNVAHQPLDVFDASGKENRILYSLPERQAFRRLLHDGLTDTFRALHPGSRTFSWWDYRAGRFERGDGWRIDYLLANPSAARRLTEAGIDAHWRGLERPSDHTPVWCRLS
jgi:exodeoxyribonuclease-3